MVEVVLIHLRRAIENYMSHGSKHPRDRDERDRAMEAYSTGGPDKARVSGVEAQGGPAERRDVRQSMGSPAGRRRGRRGDAVYVFPSPWPCCPRPYTVPFASALVWFCVDLVQNRPPLPELFSTHTLVPYRRVCCSFRAVCEQDARPLPFSLSLIPTVPKSSTILLLFCSRGIGCPEHSRTDQVTGGTTASWDKSAAPNSHQSSDHSTTHATSDGGHLIRD